MTSTTNGKTGVILDFETLSNSPRTAPILSMGCISFNWGDSVEDLKKTGFYRTCDIEEQLALGLKPTKSTIEWWQNQGEEARKVLFDKNKIPLSQLAKEFIDWTKTQGITRNTTVWVRGCYFDWPIYENLLRLTGNDLFNPLNSWAVRDIRTAIDVMYDIKPGQHSYAPNFEDLIEPYELTLHNSLDDCIKDYLQLNQFFTE